MSLNKVNVAMVENNTIVKTDVLRAEKAGSAVKIKAVKGAKYILAEGEKGYAPENITVKRVGKNLHVILEGTDENQPQLIIEDFFTNPGELVGKAEDGQWHEFISSDGDSDHEAAFLMDGESSALVLGAGTIGALDGLVVAPFALSPALLALGALAGILAAAGIATAIAHNRDNSGDHDGNNEGSSGSGDGGAIGTVLKVPVWSGVVDDHGDFQGPISNGGLTDDNTPTFNGSGTPGNIIIIRDKGEIVGSTIVDEGGKWTWTPENPLTDGEHHITPVERDDHGNESAPGEEFIVIIDTDPPARPEIGQVFDDVEPKVGPVANGGYTNDTSPTFSGAGQIPGDTIIIVDNGKEIGSVVVGQDGSWSFTPEQPFEDGDHSVEIVARDPAGNRSEPSEPWLVIVDTEIPGKPGTGNTPGLDDIIDDVGPITGSIAKGGVTDDYTPTLEGSHQRPGTIVTIIDNGQKIGSTVADANGGWRFTPPDLPEGDHNFSIIIETPTGYVSPESDPWLVVIDLQAPAAPVIREILDDQGAVTGPISDGDVTDDAQPKISGTAEAGSTVIVYDRGVEIGRVQADNAGNWSFTPVPPLLNGDHEISAKAQDAAGNIGDASNSIGFALIAGGNATAPSITGAWDDVEAFTGLLQSGSKTNDARPELRGTAPAGEAVTIIMDGKVQGTVTADSNGQWSWTPAADVTDGAHNFRAETQDGAGNPAATGSFQLVIDTQAPDAATGIVADDNVGPVVGPISNGDTTDDSTPTIGGEGEPGGTVIIKDGDAVIGSTVVGDDGHWSFTPDTPLPDG
ncbi:Ig-like domain-containing protein, partial [Pantoea sp. JK]|uniref:Ig-like domain-containing protein n=1 Tax=Pantoea sp. JK TaxID=2871703 RepID=UPI0022378533